jgi:hypothetical protein
LGFHLGRFRLLRQGHGWARRRAFSRSRPIAAAATAPTLLVLDSTGGFNENFAICSARWASCGNSTTSTGSHSRASSLSPILWSTADRRPSPRRSRTIRSSEHLCRLGGSAGICAPLTGVCLPKSPVRGLLHKRGQDGELSGCLDHSGAARPKYPAFPLGSDGVANGEPGGAAQLPANLQFCDTERRSGQEPAGATRSP